MSITFPPPNPQVGDPIALRQISNAVREALKGNLVFQGGLTFVPVIITHADTPYNVVAASVVLADASSGVITINLPAATDSNGVAYFIKKADSTANAVTIDGSGAELIDGAATKVLNTAWASTRLVCDGTRWLSI